MLINISFDEIVILVVVYMLQINGTDISELYTRAYIFIYIYIMNLFSYKLF